MRRMDDDLDFCTVAALLGFHVAEMGGVAKDDLFRVTARRVFVAGIQLYLAWSIIRQRLPPPPGTRGKLGG